MPDLAVYAVHPERSRGRVHPEEAPVARSEFQRDRDRIIHSTAFRRLEYKTQVFVNHEGDLFRTRLTHSLEVAQIGRSVARALALNEDLVEAICLAHDLGHTPFGHAGQDALNACMKEHGGFEHNLQSLRVVDVLEERYATFDGLNLCFETREGILKHCSRAAAASLGELGQRFLDGHQPSLEAQVANLADEIAYNNHDVDDGIRSGLVSLDELAVIDIVRRHLDVVRSLHPGLGGRRLVHETVRRMINTLIGDLVARSRVNIDAAAPSSVAAVRLAPPLIAFSPVVREEQQELKRFLRQHLYQHFRVARMSRKSKRVVVDLFQAFFEEPYLLPPQFQARHRDDGPRAIADYVAGMTDRFAIREHRRLYEIDES
jgi:dGTPase